MFKFILGVGCGAILTIKAIKSQRLLQVLLMKDLKK